MGLTNKGEALYFATGIDLTGLYSGMKDAEKRMTDYEKTLTIN